MSINLIALDKLWLLFCKSQLGKNIIHKITYSFNTDIKEENFNIVTNTVTKIFLHIHTVLLHSLNNAVLHYAGSRDDGSGNDNNKN